MARCEDFPCCGHEMGCCPDFDEDGQQLNMICVCGAKLPVNSRVSICSSCMRDPYDYDGDGDQADDYDGDQVEEQNEDDYDRDYSDSDEGNLYE